MMMVAPLLVLVAGAFGMGAAQSAAAWRTLQRAGGLGGVPPISPDRRRPTIRRTWTSRVALAAAAFMAGWFGGGPPIAAASLAGALGLPVLLAKRRAARRSDLLESQLSTAIDTIAAGLRAGSSLLQSISLAAQEANEPVASNLRAVWRSSELGVPLGEALDRWAEAEGSKDVRLVVGVLHLHQRTGGDLPRVLDQLSQTLRDRRAAAGEVRSLTAQARLSGAILGLLPVGFFLFLSITSREDIAAAYRTRSGATAIVAGLALDGAAYLWIRRLLRVAP